MFLINSARKLVWASFKVVESLVLAMLSSGWFLLERLLWRINTEVSRLGLWTF